MTGEEERIITARQSGVPCAAIAEELDIPEARIWYVSKKYNCQVYRPCRIPVTIRDVLKIHDAITIENGATGGLIVTLDDTYTGSEYKYMHEAIKSAVLASRVK